MRDGFGMLLKEIKLLGDRMKSVEKKVGITKKGTASNDLQITASSPPKCGQEPGSESVNGAKAGQNDAQEPSSSKELSLVVAKEPEVKPSEQSGEPSVLVLDKGAPTVSDVHQGESRRQTKKAKAMEFVSWKEAGQGYDPFAPFDKKMSKVLTDWVKLDPANKFNKKVRKLKRNPTWRKRNPAWLKRNPALVEAMSDGSHERDETPTFKLGKQLGKREGQATCSS
ncbi:hypothetical protein F2Q69_00030085 [Brassica cretica]|uniref:Uncharacterized protein n=1 Tax=Brassica cretica TaxID=69181 RepID=A0A8S9RVX3_BRACR|nr:hypothetical protein F2Q69_00030085 [Brassica cretica]